MLQIDLHEDVASGVVLRHDMIIGILDSLGDVGAFVVDLVRHVRLQRRVRQIERDRRLARVVRLR